MAKDITISETAPDMAPDAMDKPGAERTAMADYSSYLNSDAGFDQSDRAEDFAPVATSDEDDAGFNQNDEAFDTQTGVAEVADKRINELDDQRLNALLEGIDLNVFSVERWRILSKEAKERFVFEFAFRVVRDLDIDIRLMPPIEYRKFEGEEANVRGAFNPADNTISLNMKLLDDPMDVLQTLFHEMRHAYQLQRALNDFDGTEGDAYLENFVNYQSDDYYAYRRQTIEADAREYALNVIIGIQKRLLARKGGLPWIKS